MEPTTQNVPDDIRQQAKLKALKIIQATQGAISFVRAEELDTQALFVPVVTILKANQDDFHNLKGGVKMPKSHYTNQIAEATGVDIVNVSVRKLSEFVWAGHAEGERRMPDGTMRKGSGEYEFNAEHRAEEDFLSKPDDYKSDISKRKHVLETARFGAQRASTGARLALIRFLVGIPTGFTAENIQRAMIFVRVDRNVNGIMQDPTMRAAAIDHALGVTREIYGPEKQLGSAPVTRTVDLETQEVLPPAENVDTFELTADDAPPPEEKTPIQKARDLLETYREKVKPSPSASKLLEDTLAKKDPAATLEEINSAIDRFEHWLQKYSKGGAA